VGGSYLWLRRGRVLRTVALVMCAVLVAACGSSTSPGPTITPSPAPVVRPTPRKSSNPSPSTPTPITPSASPSSTPEAQIDALLGQMTVDQKIGQLFMVAFYGDVAAETDPTQVASNRSLIGTDNVADAIARYHLGGVIYFTWAGNMVTPAQIATLSNSIQAAAAAQAPGVPLLIATDQEGGSVVRLPAGATGYPGNMALGATGATDLARSTGKQMGQELRAVGINDVLAPVGDVNVNPANPIIGLRSFGSDPTAVASMTAAMVQGFQANAGLGATVKHFPGHGDTDIDSHSQLPIINHSASTWASLDQPPFAAAIDAGVDSVMVGHLAFPALDATRTPASLSAHLVTDVLRGQMGFGGVVITDALTMGALRDGYGDDRIPVMALLAGDDILLMPQSLPVAYAAVKAALASGEISAARLDDSVRRILALKIELGLFDAPPVSADAAAGALGTAAHRALEARDAESSVTLLANDGGLLPISVPASGAPYLVVGPTAAPVAALSAILRGRGLTAGTYVTGVSPASSVARAAAARAAGYGTVIALTLDADADPGQQRVVTNLAASGKPVITVSIGRPYDQAYYRAAINVCLYSDSAASLRALVRVLFGEIGPIGRLPVAIPSANDSSTILYPLGFGLSY
jgi:beta-N-acetylhexosaminidase